MTKRPFIANKKSCVLIQATDRMNCNCGPANNLRWIIYSFELFALCRLLGFNLSLNSVNDNHLPGGQTLGPYFVPGISRMLTRCWPISAMPGKSKRYFLQDRVASRSPEHESKSSFTTSKEKDRPLYDSHSSKYSDNKSASKRLKKSLHGGEMKSIPKVDISPGQSVEEQVKRANAIEEINYNPFQPKNFFSTRTAPAVNLDDIPLPRDDSSWRENPKLLLATNVSTCHFYFTFRILTMLSFNSFTSDAMQKGGKISGVIIWWCWKWNWRRKHNQFLFPV